MAFLRRYVFLCIRCVKNRRFFFFKLNDDFLFLYIFHLLSIDFNYSVQLIPIHSGMNDFSFVLKSISGAPTSTGYLFQNLQKICYLNNFFREKIRLVIKKLLRSNQNS